MIYYTLITHNLFFDQTMCPPNPEIASFFFLGTSQHRVTNKNALTALYKATKNNYKDEKLSSHVCLFDGVGSNPQGSSSDIRHVENPEYSREKRKTHPMPGSYIYDSKQRKKIPIETTVIPQSIKDLMKRFNGTVAGDGIDELLFEAILRLKGLENEGTFPSEINLHGFSRGAETCVRFANLLDGLYPKLKVNLFLIDHVSGPGHGEAPQAYTIPANVQHFEAVTMLHEYRPYFNPQDKSRYVFISPATTNATFRVYPGGHGKGMNLGNSDESNHVARLLHDDLYRFAKKTGSLPDNQNPPDINKEVRFHVYEQQQTLPLKDEDRFALYTEILENWGHYSEGVRLNTRNILQQYELNPQHQLFVNQEHAELFAAQFPNTYNWFYKNARNPFVFSAEETEDLQEEVRKELSRLKETTQNAPLFYERFCEFHKIKGTYLPDPGFLPAYSDHQSGTPLVGDELSHLKHAINSIINYETYHRKYRSFDNEVVIRLLRSTLKKAEFFPADEACHILRNSINSSLSYLNNEGHKQYLYHQLFKLRLELGPRKTEFDKIIKKYSKFIDSEQKRQLIIIGENLEWIEESELTYLQKSIEAKKIISQAVLYLQEQSGDNDEEQKLKELIKELEQLTTPILATPSLAAETAKLFAAYNSRNLFWELAYKILSRVIPIESPFVSPEKSAISAEIAESLERLDSEGKGNNLKEIFDILSLGQTKLHLHYQKHFKEYHYLNKGEFDKILMRAKKRVIEQMTGFGVAKNTDLTESTESDETEDESEDKDEGEREKDSFRFQ